MPGIILIIIALMVGAISGVFSRIPNQKFVTGEIVSIERENTVSDGRTMYMAHVEYYVNGIPYTIKTKFKSSTFYTGQKMRIAYNESAPQQAIVRPKVTTYVIMLGFSIAGIVVCYFTLLK